jgi:hypothetical protein
MLTDCTYYEDSDTPKSKPSLYSRQLEALAALDEARVRAEAARVAWLAADAEQDAANQAYNEARAALDALVKVGAA